MNLLKLRDRFQVKFDECRDPTIPTRGGGHVYQHAGRTLGILVQSGKPMRTFEALAAKIPGLRVHQVGDGEAIFLADYADESEMTAILRAARAFKRVELGEATLARKREWARGVNEERARESIDAR